MGVDELRQYELYEDFGLEHKKLKLVQGFDVRQVEVLIHDLFVLRQNDRDVLQDKLQCWVLQQHVHDE
jgi:hypothetical protein